MLDWAFQISGHLNNFKKIKNQTSNLHLIIVYIILVINFQALMSVQNRLSVSFYLLYAENHCDKQNIIVTINDNNTINNIFELNDVVS